VTKFERSLVKLVDDDVKSLDTLGPPPVGPKAIATIERDAVRAYLEREITQPLRQKLKDSVPCPTDGK
jgi:hypothetical protein